MTESSGLIRLIVHPNDYPWGKIGEDSLAGRLTKNACEPEFEFKPDQPYAELWMGTHPTNPAYLYSDKSILLSKFLEENSKYLGSSKSNFQTPFTGKKGSGSENQIKGHIPFLFKVLTCKQALPLQIHPNKELAKKLHEEDPEKFPDINHKPEIAVCLSSSFLGFAHFREYNQIVQFLTKIPEIKSLSLEIQNTIENFINQPTSDNLQKVWINFSKLSDNENIVKEFSNRIEKEGIKAFKDFKGEGFNEKEKENLVKAILNSKKYYNGDSGLFSTLFFLNLVELKKDEGIYVGADGPHAWLEGEIVELMAISDNVLNVGFTPDEEKDDINLVSKIVTYKSKSPSVLKLISKEFKSKSKSLNQNTKVYKVPFEEFSILKINSNDELNFFNGPAIAIIIKGNWIINENQNEISKEGNCYFIGAGTETIWKKQNDNEQGEIWIAFYDADAPKEEVGQK